MLVPNKNPPVYKEHIIYFIGFAFGEGFTIIDCLANMKLYVSDIVEPYKDSIIGCLGNSGTAYLLLHIVQCWHVCAVGEENQDLHMVLYCSSMMYKYYSHIGFF